MANGGKRIGMLRGATTRFCTWFYAMIRLLRLKQPLLATIHQVIFTDLDLNDRTRSAVFDIQDGKFWKGLYTILRAIYPALRALRYCDSNIPCMDKIFFLCHRTTEAIKNSVEALDDVDLFGPMDGDDSGLEIEASEVYGDDEG